MDSKNNSPSEDDYSLMILKNRLAKGEITVEEFNNLKKIFEQNRVGQDETSKVEPDSKKYDKKDILIKRLSSGEITSKEYDKLSKKIEKEEKKSSAKSTKKKMSKKKKAGIVIGIIFGILILLMSTDFNPPSHLSNTTQTWAGYYATSDWYNPQPLVTMVSASWKVAPIPNTSDSVKDMTQWIGIGGVYPDSSLIQVGTTSESSGTLQYNAWYELYPDNYQVPLMTVNAGDTVNAKITCDSSCNNVTQKWIITFIDTTTGKQSPPIKTSFSSRLLTADWIVERRCPPAIFGSCDLASSLADFGTTTFSSASATIGTTTGNINTFKHVSLNMTSNGQPLGALLSYPSSLSNDGSSFTVTRG